MATISNSEEEIIKTPLKDNSQINLENGWGYLAVRGTTYLYLSKTKHTSSFWDEFALDQMSICTKLYGKDARNGICPEVPYESHMPQAELSLRRLVLFLWRCSNNPEGIKSESWLKGIIEKTIQDIPFPDIVPTKRSNEARWPMLVIHRSWYESLSILFEICGFAIDPAIPDKREDTIILITNYGPKQGMVGYGKGTLRTFLEGNETCRTACGSIAEFTDRLREAIVTSGMPIKYREFSELCVYLNRIRSIIQPDPSRSMALYSHPSELIRVMGEISKYIPGWGKCMKELGIAGTSKTFLSADLSGTGLIVRNSVSEINYYVNTCPLFTENAQTFLNYVKRLVPPLPLPVELEEEEEDKSGWPVFEGSSGMMELALSELVERGCQLSIHGPAIVGPSHTSFLITDYMNNPGNLRVVDNLASVGMAPGQELDSSSYQRGRKIYLSLPDFLEAFDKKVRSSPPGTLPLPPKTTEVCINGRHIRIGGDIPKETKLRIKCEYIEPALKLNKLKLKL